MDILSELRAKGLEVRQNSFDPSEISLCCPFCVEMGESPDYKFRCGINLSTGLGHCFNCGWSSRRALLALIRLLGMDEQLADVRNRQLAPKPTARNATVELPEGFELLAECDENDAVFAPALAYLKRRGITQEQIERHGVGATVLDARYGYRIIFPVTDERDRLVGFVGRDWTDTHVARYMNKKGLNKAVYNCRPDLYTTRRGILSEGVTKALAIERALDNKVCSMALLGSSITDSQVNQLRKFEELILFPDPDKAGVRGMLGVAANLMTLHETVSVAWPWPKVQADDMERKEIREKLRQRRLYTPFLDMEVRMEML